MMSKYFQETLEHNDNEELPFFVYGTLRPTDYNYERLLAGRTLQERSGFYLSGAKIYDLGAFPITVEVEDKASVVWGDLIYIAADKYSEIRAMLDPLEWYSQGDPDSRYWRVARQVFNNEGEAVRAWVYVSELTETSLQGLTPQPIASGDWLAHLQSKKSS
jgi:gamma-glutamylcyclotransferase (GGCT)/AIG2-like uncharacterized protein YtfP